MIRSDFLDVHFGASRSFKAAQALLASLGLVAILASPADWKWKLGSMVLLLLLALWVHSKSGNGQQAGTIRLFEDGTALLSTTSRRHVNAFQAPHGWVSRWFSVLVLLEADGDRKHFCLVCASDNHPDEYRRLLKFLRMHSPAEEVQRMIW